MSAKPILYDYAFSGNCYKVRLLLSQLGIEYETQPIDIVEGEAQEPEFLRKNPVGQVPVLELPDGTCLRESSAILMHLAEGTRFLPSPGVSRTLQAQTSAGIERWAFKPSRTDSRSGLVKWQMSSRPSADKRVRCRATR